MKKAQGAQRANAEKRAKQRRQAGASGQGQKGKRRVKFRLGGSDMPDDPRMKMMRSNRPSSQSSQSKRTAGSAPGKGAGGDPRGAKSKPMGVARTERVKGIENEGPTIKQTFVEAAKKGFAKTSWQTVYADYSEVAEAMISRQGLPIGRKALVRRYFELIRPRQQVEQK